MNFKNFQNLNTRKKINYLFLCIFPVFFIIIYFGIIPAIDSIKNLRAELISQKIELEEKINQDKNIASLNERIKRIEPQLEILNKIFINKNRELDFITNLESVEKKNSITQKLTINPPTSDEKKLIKTVPITIEASGRYVNILQYLADIEALPYYVNVNKIEITRDTEKIFNKSTSDIGANDVRMLIGANTYWK